MVGSALLKEIEDLLLDKLDKQESLIQFFEQVDGSIRQEMLIKIFDTIDQLESEIQSMDLLFLSKFDKFKTLNGVKDINDGIAIEALQESEKQSLKLIKNAVKFIAERERALEAFKNETQEIKLNTDISAKKTSRENKAHSAYKNINK